MILSVRSGKLFADPAPGATVIGGGSSSVWIAGSIAQINAKLQTLSYYAATAGSDVLSVTVVSAAGGTPARESLPVTILTLTSPPDLLAPLTIDHGTLSIDDQSVDGLTLDLQQAPEQASSATLVLIDTTLGPNTHVDMSDRDLAGTSPRLAVAGRVELDGNVDIVGGKALVTVAQGALLVNAGTIALTASSAQITGAGTIENDGTLTFAGSGPTGATLLAAAVTGTGAITLADGAMVELGGPISAGETIQLGQNTTLRLDHPADVKATIVGFGAGDALLLPAGTADAAALAADGALTLYAGAATVATLQLQGSGGNVALQQEPDGVRITLAAALQDGRGTVRTTLPVLRFFDDVSGTQLLTNSTSESEAILASRPDLRPEGVAFTSADPNSADPAATPVYRFFDTSTGTHFYTGSEAEKDSVLATRPDLVFEPGSTLSEHATEQAGDVPVYRFFDTAHGTHLFTADAGERAAILSTRPDLQAEGIAFYAPAS